jgi:hypothetical protein
MHRSLSTIWLCLRRSRDFFSLAVQLGEAAAGKHMLDRAMQRSLKNGQYIFVPKAKNSCHNHYYWQQGFVHAYFPKSSGCRDTELRPRQMKSEPPTIEFPLINEIPRTETICCSYSRMKRFAQHDALKKSRTWIEQFPVTSDQLLTPMNRRRCQWPDILCSDCDQRESPL